MCFKIVKRSKKILGTSITFVWSVVPGATDKNYGVHVAKLSRGSQGDYQEANEVLREIERETENRSPGWLEKCRK